MPVELAKAIMSKLENPKTKDPKGQDSLSKAALTSLDTIRKTQLEKT